MAGHAYGLRETKISTHEQPPRRCTRRHFSHAWPREDNNVAPATPHRRASATRLVSSRAEQAVAMVTPGAYQQQMHAYDDCPHLEIKVSRHAQMSPTIFNIMMVISFLSSASSQPDIHIWRITYHQSAGRAAELSSAAPSVDCYHTVDDFTSGLDGGRIYFLIGKVMRAIAGRPRYSSSATCSGARRRPEEARTPKDAAPRQQEYAAKILSFHAPAAPRPAAAGTRRFLSPSAAAITDGAPRQHAKYENQLHVKAQGCLAV